MADRVRMNEKETASAVKPSYGFSSIGGTPGKAAGSQSMAGNQSFVVEGINSEAQEQILPSMPMYWNVNGTSEDTDVSNNQP